MHNIFSKWKLLHKTTGRWKLKILNSKNIVGNFENRNYKNLQVIYKNRKVDSQILSLSRKWMLHFKERNDQNDSRKVLTYIFYNYLENRNSKWISTKTY